MQFVRKFSYYKKRQFQSKKVKFSEGVQLQRPAPRGRFSPSVESWKDAFDSGPPALVGAKQGACTFLNEIIEDG
ncbi:hypothetical protein D1B33_13725 [Lysinibacillus yapensis]|uniref:Uncharacterized protein n=1 Tax=Ureibacillus yapensis TaxID=2304605 RepID=A0A396S5B2_9BACL|nr:hypothetical protein D1B33_13725 [Lysinibacillus yapensis]